MFSHWRLRPLVAAIVAAGAIAPETDHAASLTVATLAESSGSACTLRDALDSVNKQANQGQCVASGAYGTNDSVGFAPALTGTITFFKVDPLSANPADPSALVVQRATSIQAPGSARLTLTCGNVIARLLEVDAGASAVSLSGVTVANCQARGPGGGVYVNAQFAKAGPTVLLTDVTLSGNRGTLGGGLAVAGTNVGATVTLTACSVLNNSATFGGGLQVSSNDIAPNAANVSVVDSLVAGNRAQLGGGAYVDSFSAGIAFTRATLSANQAFGGGGIYLHHGTGTVLDSTLVGNRALDTGGGVFVDHGQFSATNSTLSGNNAGGKAGAVYVTNGFNGSLLLANSTIAANVAGLVGAVAVENTIAFERMTPAAVVNALPIAQASAPVTIIDTLIAGNQPAPEIEANDPGVPGGVPWDVSYSVIGQPGTVMLVGTGNQTGGAVPPPFGAGGWLGPLQNNGGSTQTHALLTNVPDPALDAGDPAFAGLTYDQRGAPFLRVQNGRVDVGAFEAPAPLQPVPGPRGLALAMLAALLALLGWRRRRG